LTALKASISELLDEHATQVNAVRGVGPVMTSDAG
jgi:hypothetical protein